MTLTIHHVHKNFGGLKALDGANLKVDPNKITAIIGPNGSGKTTLFNTISGLLKINQGYIIFNDKRLTNFKDFQIARNGISRTFQDVKLFKNLTIRDHLEIALSNHDENIFKSFFKREQIRKEKVERIIKTVQLHKNLNTYASDLSYGQRKLLDLATALAKPHEILLLDEPVAGINPELRKKIQQIIKYLNKQGETILLIEHDMNFVMELADYIYVMDEGKVIAQGKPKQIQNNKKVLQAYLGD
jgi:branched-chain amino acid transport system ATP-binding protein